MKKIHFLGECMVELKAIDANTMRQSFAGDVYNSAVYLKRTFPDVAVSVVTALGNEKLSNAMVEQFKTEHLTTQYVYRHPDKVAGLYLIETDDSGERSFTYWRSDSAARQVVQFLTSEELKQLSDADMFFISGISLAVLTPESRHVFWSCMSQLHEAGCKIIFDPNYRARLWESKDEAREQFERAFSLADIVMPGVEDLTELYGIQTVEQVISFCQPFNCAEIVVKNGPDSVITADREGIREHTITPVDKVVDTTSAGDAFNGAYLGARLNNQSIDEAVNLGAKAAAIVIQHPGAITPKDDFIQAMANS